MITKSQIVERAKKQLHEIDQYFNDVDHWNRTHVPEDRIETDPGGMMMKMHDILEQFVAVYSPTVDI